MKGAAPVGVQQEVVRDGDQVAREQYARTAGHHGDDGGLAGEGQADGEADSHDDADDHEAAEHPHRQEGCRDPVLENVRAGVEDRRYR